MPNRIFSGDFYFTAQHEWLKLENNTALVGLTSLAKKELGEIKHIEIHTLGKDLMEDQVFGRVKTKRYLCKLIMPVRGTIIGANTINYTLLNNCDKALDPEEWIVKIKISQPLKSDKLFTLDQYKACQTEGALHMVKYFLKFGE